MILITGVLLAAGAVTDAAPSKKPVINTEDVDRFYKVYDGAGGHPGAQQLQRDYIDPGSEGLHQFARVRNITGARIAVEIVSHPEVYSGAKRCLTVLPKVRERLQAALINLVHLYPQARLPPVTIAVGRGKPVAVGSPVSGVEVGLEALCATDFLNPNLEDRFVYVIAHEYAHVQQVPTIVDDENPTVLEGSLMEGAAELVAELTAGNVAYGQLAVATRGHELEIETAFVSEADSKDLSHWLFNTRPGKPGDLGYWVGYRIVKTYYQQASDKGRALREILAMTDPQSFLARSGWHPGIQLDDLPRVGRVGRRGGG